MASSIAFTGNGEFSTATAIFFLRTSHQGDELHPDLLFAACSHAAQQHHHICIIKSADPQLGVGDQHMANYTLCAAIKRTAIFFATRQHANLHSLDRSKTNENSAMQAFENTSTNVAASQMRNALNNLSDTVKDPEQRKVRRSHRVCMQKLSNIVAAIRD